MTAWLSVWWILLHGLFGQYVAVPFTKVPAAGITTVDVGWGDVAASGLSTLDTSAHPSNLVAGNTIVFLAASSASGNTITGIVDHNSHVGTFTQCSGALNNAGLNSLDGWTAHVNTTDASDYFTVTWASAVVYSSAFARQVSGANATTPCETAAIGSAVGNSVTSGSFSPAGTHNYNLTLGTQNTSGTNSWQAGPSYTLVQNSGSGANHEIQERTSVPSGAQTAEIDWTGASNALFSTTVSIKP